MNIHPLCIEDLKLVPPPQMMWVQAHYCEAFRDSITLAEHRRDSVAVFNGKKRSNLNMVRLGLGGQQHSISKSWEIGPSLFGDTINIDEPYMFIFWNQDGTDEMFQARCAIDEKLYLLPYLFRSIECEYEINKGVITLGHCDILSMDRWDRLKDMNIVQDIDDCIKPMKNLKFSDGKIKIKI